MWIKICGVRDVDTAREIAKLGADAIGLNFYPPSPRCVTVSQAVAIAHSIRQQATAVGLFVNHSIKDIREICRNCELTTIQLHGDEPPEFLAELQDFQILRAFRIGPEGLHPVLNYLARCDRLNVRPHGCLIDAAVPGTYGGSGVTVDWRQLAIEYAANSLPPLILAGGLTADNVAEAINIVHPWGVDVASGVEISKGVKDLKLVERLIQAARRCEATAG